MLIWSLVDDVFAGDGEGRVEDRDDESIVASY